MRMAAGIDARIVRLWNDKKKIDNFWLRSFLPNEHRPGDCVTRAGSEVSFGSLEINFFLVICKSRKSSRRREENFSSSSEVGAVCKYREKITSLTSCICVEAKVMKCFVLEAKHEWNKFYPSFRMHQVTTKLPTTPPWYFIKPLIQLLSKEKRITQRKWNFFKFYQRFGEVENKKVINGFRKVTEE